MDKYFNDLAVTPEVRQSLSSLQEQWVKWTQKELSLEQIQKLIDEAVQEKALKQVKTWLLEHREQAQLVAMRQALLEVCGSPKPAPKAAKS